MAGELTLPFGDRIRGRRIQAGLTQARLARHAGVSRRHLAALEKGANVSINILARVSQVLEIPLTETLGLVSVTIETTVSYRSVFISYGAPDEAIAGRLFDDLKRAGVRAFFFPVSARPGRRIHRVVADAIMNNDCVMLLCSKRSLSRPGVTNEIEQILAREAAEGGTELIIPIVLDDSFFVDDLPLPPDAALQVRQRVAVDFRIAATDDRAWEVQFERLLKVLRRDDQ